MGTGQRLRPIGLALGAAFLSGAVIWILVYLFWAHDKGTAGTIIQAVAAVVVPAFGLVVWLVKTDETLRSSRVATSDASMVQSGTVLSKSRELIAEIREPGMERLRGVSIRQTRSTDRNGIIRESSLIQIEEISYYPQREEE